MVVNSNSYEFSEVRHFMQRHVVKIVKSVAVKDDVVETQSLQRRSTAVTRIGLFEIKLWGKFNWAINQKA